MARIPRRALWALLLLAAFLVVVLTMVFTFVFAGAGTSNPVLLFFISNHFEIMVAVSLGGLAVGGAVYKLMGEEAHTATAASEANAKLLLSLLPAGERQVVEFLARSNGNGLQSEIARLEGMSRLRAHRILQGLKRRGLIHVEQIGKLNKVFLSPSIASALAGVEVAKPAIERASA